MTGGPDFRGRMGRTIADQRPWPATNRPPDGARSVLVALFDDTGFSDLGDVRAPENPLRLPYLNLFLGTKPVFAASRGSRTQTSRFGCMPPPRVAGTAV